MAFAQLDHFLLHPQEGGNRGNAKHIHHKLSWQMGILFGLLMGMMAISIIVGPQMTGRPWMTFPMVMGTLTFGIISMILSRRGTGDEEV